MGNIFPPADWHPPVPIDLARKIGRFNTSMNYICSDYYGIFYIGQVNQSPADSSVQSSYMFSATNFTSNIMNLNWPSGVQTLLLTCFIWQDNSRTASKVFKAVHGQIRNWPVIGFDVKRIRHGKSVGSCYELDPLKNPCCWDNQRASRRWSWPWVSQTAFGEFLAPLQGAGGMVPDFKSMKWTPASALLILPSEPPSPFMGRSER